MVKALILKGDKTTHGGTVLNGFSDYTIQGIPVAGVGHLVACPLCKGVFPIVQGYGGLTVNGVFVALDGHVTACGAKLIPSQHEEVVDDGGGGVIGAVAQAVLQQEPEQPQQTQYASLSDEQRSMINDGVYRPDQDQGGIAQTAAEEDDLAPGEVRGETGREETLPEWSNENSYNTLFNEASELAKKDGFRYDVARDQNKPYTQDDVNDVQRDVEALKKGEYWQQRLQKAEQESKNNPNKSYLQFENFDKQDLLKQSECSPEELENNLRFLEQSKRIKPGSLENFRRTGKWPENQPIPARPGNLTPEGDYDWYQAPQDGFLLDSEGNPIQESIVPKKGDTIDRYGGEGGCFASPMDDPNNPIPYEQRSLPYVRDPSAYHRYRFNDDMSNFRQWVENSDPQTREDIEKYMRDYGVTYNDLARKGPIAPAFGEAGGGTQYQFGIPLNLLRRSGILSEIPNN